MSILPALVHWFQAHSIVLMLAIFVGMGVWIYWPSRKGAMERHAHIPLEDEG